MFLMEQARQRYLMKTDELINMRGMMPMTIHLLEQYGVEPMASYHARDKINYGVIGRKIDNIVNVALHQYSSR